jgi:hypothetical protein
MAGGLFQVYGFSMFDLCMLLDVSVERWLELI